MKEMIQHCINANIDEAYKVGFHVLCWCRQTIFLYRILVCFEEFTVCVVF